LRSELPGLWTSDFKSVGKFGIGFFSVFMLGPQVRVTTMRYRIKENEKSDQWLLEFENGLSDRPTIRKPDASERLLNRGTKISVELNSNVIETILEEKLLIMKLLANRRTVDEKLEEIVMMLCPTMDIKVVFQTTGLGFLNSIVEPDDWKDLTAIEVMRRNGTVMFSGDLVPLKDIESGGLLGRLQPGRNFDSALITHQGLIVGKLSGVVGVVMGHNSMNLARSEAQPLGKVEDWRDWALSALNQSNAVLLSKEHLLNLHPICPELDLPVYLLGGEGLSIKQLKAKFASMLRVRLLAYESDHDSSRDNFSSDDFDKDLSYSPDVLEIPLRKSVLCSNLKIPQIDYQDSFEKALISEWGLDFETQEEITESVGTVNHSSVFREVTIYDRTNQYRRTRTLVDTKAY
jgi:hypothetical protein